MGLLYSLHICPGLDLHLAPPGVTSAYVGCAPEVNGDVIPPPPVSPPSLIPSISLPEGLGLSFSADTNFD